MLSTSISETDSLEPISRQARSVGGMIHTRATIQPDAIALRFADRAQSFSTFDQHSNKTANALLAMGLKKGDRVAYVGMNSDVYFELLSGALKCGVVLIPISWRLSEQEVAFILSDCQAKAIFYEGAFRQLLPSDVDVVRLEILGADNNISNFERWRDDESANFDCSTIKPNDVALQIYTSGTTGMPKGVLLTHGNILASWQNGLATGMAWARWDRSDTGLAVMPVAHIAGNRFVINCLMNGAQSIILRKFDAGEVLDKVEEHQVTRLWLAPSALRLLVERAHRRSASFRSVRTILYGSSPMPLGLLKDCIEIFGCDFCQQYGATETTGAVTYLAPEHHSPEGGERMMSAGEVLPGVELKVVTPQGTECEPNEAGEVLVRSHQVMAGYWNLPSASITALDKDGWYRTGDVGYLDSHGFLFIVDRLKDLIISGGENIYPAEIERAIASHPAVAEVAVIGVKSETWGETPRSIIVLREGTRCSAEEIRNHLQGRLASFKLPTSVVFAADLPRNPAGKVSKPDLRKLYPLD